MADELSAVAEDSDWPLSMVGPASAVLIMFGGFGLIMGLAGKYSDVLLVGFTCAFASGLLLLWLDHKRRHSEGHVAAKLLMVATAFFLAALGAFVFAFADYKFGPFF